MTDPRADASNWSGGVVGNGWYLPDLANVVPGLTQNSGSWSYAAPTPTPVFNPYSDPGYIAGAASVNNTNTHAGAYHDYSQLSAEQNYGYDPSGNLITSGEGYNPYSQAAVLQRNYDATQRGTVNNYAAQGELYSGALLNKQASDKYNFNAGSDALKRAASGTYHGQDYSLQQTQDAGSATLSSLVSTALANFLTGQQGS